MLARGSSLRVRSPLMVSVRSFAGAAGNTEESKYIAKQQQRIAKLREEAAAATDLQTQFKLSQQIQDIEIETRRYFFTNPTTGKVQATTKTPVDTKKHLFFRDPLEAKFAEEARQYFSSPVYKLAVEIASTNQVPADKLKALGLPVPELPNLADSVIDTLPNQKPLHFQASEFNEQQRFAEILKDVEKKLKTDPQLASQKIPQISYEDFAKWRDQARLADPDSGLRILGSA